MTVVLNYQIQL